MNWKQADPYHPLDVNYVTHEDRQYWSKVFGVHWAGNYDGKNSALVYADGRSVSQSTLDVLNQWAENGNEYALKLMREMSKAKILGRFTTYPESKRMYG